MKGLIKLSFALILVGAIVFTVTMTANGWDFSKMSLVKYQTVTSEIEEGFSSITVEGRTEDVRILPSNDGKCKIVIKEEESAPHSIEVKDGVLTIKKSTRLSWYKQLFNFGKESVTVYLPEIYLDNIKIDITTGDVEIKGLNANDVYIGVKTGDVTLDGIRANDTSIKSTTGDIEVLRSSLGSLKAKLTTGDIAVSDVESLGDFNLERTTGDLYIKNASCDNLFSESTSGDTELKNTILSGKLDIESTTGDITLSGCDFSSGKIEATTGDVSGSILTDKIVHCHTSTGSIDVPRLTTGGLLEIDTTTGDIEIKITK